MTRNIQQPATNSSSTQIVEVPTATGFNAGDLVYYNNGDYKGPSSISYAGSSSYPYTNTGAGISGGTVGTESLMVPQTSANIGSSIYRGSDLLVSGNIVQVFTRLSDNFPYFQILDTNNAIVYGPTQITAAACYGSQIAVAAMTGGQFLVWYQTSDTNYNWALYSSVGAFIGGQTALNTGQSTLTGMGVCAAANGNAYVAYINDNGGTAYVQAHYVNGTTGAQITNMGSIFSPTSLPVTATLAMTKYSTGGFVLFCWAGSSSTQYTARFYNTGTLAGTSTINVTTIAQNTYDCATLTSGTIVYIYQSSSSIIGYSTSSALTLSSPVTLSTNSNYLSSNTPSVITVKSLSAGGYLLAIAESSTRTLQYAFFNSSSVPLSGGTAGSPNFTPLPQCIVSFARPLCAVELTSNVIIYGNTVASSNQTQLTYGAAINKTTYAPAYTSTITQTSSASAVSTITSVGNAYLAGTTPTSLQYYAGTTSSTSTSVGGYASFPNTTISQTGCDSIASATLPNGTVLIAYRNSTTYAISIAVYSTNGVLQQTISVGLGFANTSFAPTHLKIAAMSSGKFVVAYASASTTITTVIYSSAYAVLYTGTITTSSFTANGNNFAVAGLAGDKYVICYNVSSTFYYATYSNTNTVVVSATSIEAITATAVSCYGDNAGNFVVSYNGTATNQRNYNYRYNGSTYTQNSFSSQTTAVAGKGSAIVINSAGVVNFCNWNSSTAVNYGYGTVGGTNTSNTNIGSATMAGQCFAMGLTGVGSATFAFLSSATVMTVYAVVGQNTLSSTITNPSSTIYTGTVAFNATNPCLNITQGSGYTSFISWLDTNGYPTFTIINSFPYVATTGTTTNVTTPAAGVSINPTSTSASTTIPNTVLAGVAATTAAANTAGQVIINGPAQLSSSYPASGTGAFDYTGLPISGVKGIYSGRNITLQGNS